MDVDQLKQLIQQYILTPLHNLPSAVIHFLEANHDQSVRDVQEAIGLLFAPGAPPFQGQAADALAEYVGNYLDAEEALSPYAGCGSSERVNTLLRTCAQLLAREESLLQAIQGGGAWGAAGATMSKWEQQSGEQIPPDPENPAWDVVQFFILLGTAGAYLWASADQRGKIEELTGNLNVWVNQVQMLAQQPDPPGSQLPPPPRQVTQAVMMDVASIDSLTQQQRQVQDILQWLTANGVYGIDQSDVENLVKLGYDRDTIIQILLAGIPTTLSRAEINAQFTDLQSRIDESQKKFSLPEKRLAYLLSSEGHTVVALSEGPTRTPDALVDGVRTESKSLKPGATSNTVKDAVQASIKRGGQARDIIIDARGSGLTIDEVRRTFARLKNITRGRVDSIRIIGDGFDVTSTDFN